VDRNAHIQSRLVDSLLDLSRIEAGKLDLRFEAVDLRDVISAAVEVVRNESTTKGVTLHVEFAADRVVLQGDAARLQQIVWNLLLNAIKFTPTGGSITVTLRKAGQRAQIVVADNGQGIEASFLPYVFERFTQAPDDDQSHHGLGIGLAIVHELAKAHGASVDVESAGKNKGSVFTVTLPLSAEQQTRRQSAADGTPLQNIPGDDR
jgi:signal transduction histidine kinase